MSSDKKRLDYLKNQFSSVGEETFEKIVDCDPTPEKKYSSWLLKLYSKSNLNLNDLPTLREVVKMHSSLKDKIPVEFRDINKFDSVISFMFSMNVWFTNRFVENENNIKHLRNGGDMLFENDDISIVKVLSFEGSTNYGSSTSWCTLRFDSYISYAKSGNLYIIIPKSGRYKKYFKKKSQLHFGKNEFRDDSNEAIDLIDIVFKNPELYEPIGSLVKSEEVSLYPFFNIEKCDRDDIVSLINKHNFKILNFIKNFSKDFIDALFVEFGEKAYAHIPNSKNKIISYVSNIEEGLKKLLVKGEEEITPEIFEQSVLSFPWNILLMSCEDEKLWEQAVTKESWLINRSPFINNPDKLVDVISNNFFILKHISPEKIFNLSQREKIATELVANNCDNYLELLACLGKFDDEFQIGLVERASDCIHFLVLPCEKAFEKQKEIKTKEENIRKKREEEAVKKYKKQHSNYDCDWDTILDDYNRNGEWDVERLIEIISYDGHKYYQDKDSNMLYSNYLDALKYLK